MCATDSTSTRSGSPRPVIDASLRFPGADVLEHTLVVAVGEVRRGALIHHLQVDALAAVIQADQPLGLGEGQRLQQHAVDDAEDGGGGADAERQRQDRDDGESGLRDEPAARVADVLPEIGEHEPSSLSRSCVIVEALRPAIDRRSRMRSIGVPEVCGQAGPVRDLRPRIGIGLGIRHAAREGLAIEVFELRRELADDARLARAGEIGQRQMGADVVFPLTHRRCP